MSEDHVVEQPSPEEEHGKEAGSWIQGGVSRLWDVFTGIPGLLCLAVSIAVVAATFVVGATIIIGGLATIFLAAFAVIVLTVALLAGALITGIATLTPVALLFLLFLSLNSFGGRKTLSTGAKATVSKLREEGCI